MRYFRRKTIRRNPNNIQGPNFFLPPGRAAIADALQTNTTLRHLQLSNCDIGDGGDGWRAMACFLGDNTTLQHLDLSQCSSLDDDACFVLGSCMEGNTALKILQLHIDDADTCQVSSQGVTSLFFECWKRTIHWNVWKCPSRLPTILDSRLSPMP